MPAGYIADNDGKSWLLYVGQEYSGVEDIAGALLERVDGLGDVRLADVADVEGSQTEGSVQRRCVQAAGYRDPVYPDLGPERLDAGGLYRR